jgi:hypothetical protein
MKHDAAIEHHVMVLRIQPESLGEVANRGDVVADDRIGAGAIVEAVAAIGIERDGLRVVANGCFRIAQSLP